MMAGFSGRKLKQQSSPDRHTNTTMFDCFYDVDL